MDVDVCEAYESLCSRDRMVVDAMIIHLRVKDVENRKLHTISMQQLRRADDLELRLRSSEAGD